LMGTNLNFNPDYDAFNPKIALAENTPYVTWYENASSGSQIYVKFYNGTSFSWESVGGVLNLDPIAAAVTPDIVIGASGIYVVWSEPVGSADQINVKYWAFPPPAPTSTPTVGPSPTPTPPAAVTGLAQNTVLAYPNPASQQVTFAFRADAGSGTAVVRLYNTHYRLVAQASADAPGGQGSMAMDVSGIAQGVYFYQVTVNGKKLPMGKVVVAR